MLNMGYAFLFLLGDCKYVIFGEVVSVVVTTTVHHGSHQPCLVCAYMHCRVRSAFFLEDMNLFEHPGTLVVSGLESTLIVITAIVSLFILYSQFSYP